MEYLYKSFPDYLKSIKLVNNLYSKQLSDILGVEEYQINHWLYHYSTPRPLAAVGLFYLLCDARIERWKNMEKFMDMFGYYLYNKERLEAIHKIKYTCVGVQAKSVGEFLRVFKNKNKFDRQTMSEIFMTSRYTLQDWITEKTVPTFLSTVGIPYILRYDRDNIIKFVEDYSQYNFYKGGRIDG